MDARPTIYLLIEEGHRELRSRVLIGILAASRGHPVVIGPQWLLGRDFSRLPSGIMLFKGNNLVQGRNMRRARAAGHAIASIEEEALTLSDATEILRCYSQHSVECCNLFLVQGSFQRDCLVRAHPRIADRIAVTGNPRTDVLRNEFTGELRMEARRLRARFGRFVLVNTNFGSVNPAVGDTLTLYRRCIQVGLVNPDDPSGLRDFLTWAEWEKDNLHCVVAVTSALLRARPDLRIVVRPHPAEDPGRWRDWLDVGGTVDVIREGDHLAWTVASDVMIHTSGTTGIEAMLLGAANISLTPGENPWHELFSINQVCPTAKTPAEAVGLVLEHLDSPGGSRLQSKASAADFANFLFVDDGLAARRVVDALGELAPSDQNHETLGRGSGEPLTGLQGEKYGVTVGQIRSLLASTLSALRKVGDASGIRSVDVHERSNGVFVLNAGSSPP